MPNPTGQDLEALVRWPREDLHIEIKEWLDLNDNEAKADTAQALLALANHGGGFLIFGFREKDDGSFEPASSRPADLSSYSQDAVNGIVSRFAEPPFHCTVNQVTHPDTGEVYPVVSVPGGHRVPIRSKRDGPNGKHVRQNTYYIRRPGPASEAPQSGREWDELLARCVKSAKEDLVDAFRVTLHGFGERKDSLEDIHDAWEDNSSERWQELLAEHLPDEEPSRFQYGTWSASYLIDSESLKTVTMEEFKQILSRNEVRESGYSPWAVFHQFGLQPYYYDGGFEFWLADPGRPIPEFSDFWKAHPDGKFYMRRGYSDDSPDLRFKPGTLMDYTLPIYHTCYCLLHAARMAEALDVPHAQISMRLRWGGLKDRLMKSWTEQRLLTHEHRSRQDEVTGSLVVPANQIENNLPEAALKLIRPLYDVFNCPYYGIKLIRETVEKIRKRQ